jgi:hypothetical protein
MERILKIIINRVTLVSLFGIILIIFLVDYYVGKKQDEIIKAKEAKIERLEEQASYMLSADIRDIQETVDIEMSEKYEVTLRIDNVADEPVYISHPYVKALVQTGKISWTEVSVKDKKEKNDQVYKIEEEGQSVFRKIVTISRDIPYNEYLIRKYMHIRFYIFMYVLPESGFKEGEVAERRSSTYVYLKPYYISDDEIREVIDFGDTKVPSYMPITAFRNWTETMMDN